MVSGDEAAAPTASISISTSEYEAADGAWERQFIDDLTAANRLKNFLVTQGIDVPEPVLKGLARLSNRFRSEMNTFVDNERGRLRRRSLLGAWMRPSDKPEPL